MALKDVFPIIVIITNILSFLLSISFIIGFIRAREKTCAGKMIVILNIYMMLLPFVDVIREIAKPEGFARDFLESIDFACFEFSLFWTTNLGVFTYKITKGLASYFNEEQFLRNSLITCFLLSVIYFCAGMYKPFDIYVYDDDIGFTTYDYTPGDPLNNFLIFLVFELIGRTIPAIINFFCYLQVYKVVKDNIFGLNQTKSNLTRLILMAVCPIVCFVPMSITALVLMCLQQRRPLELICIRYIFIWVFLLMNLLNYWFLVPKSEPETPSNVSMQRLGTVVE